MKSTQSSKPCNDCEVEQGSLFSPAGAPPRTEAGLVEVRGRVDAILAGGGLKKDAEALLQEHSMRYMRRQVLCLFDSVRCSVIPICFFMAAVLDQASLLRPHHLSSSGSHAPDRCRVVQDHDAMDGEVAGGHNQQSTWFQGPAGENGGVQQAMGSLASVHRHEGLSFWGLAPDPDERVRVPGHDEVCVGDYPRSIVYIRI